MARLSTPTSAALVIASLSLACTGVAAGASYVPAGAKRLSNERTLTRWAHVVYDEVIHARPAPGSRVIGRLRQVTEDGYLDTYLLLRSYTDPSGREWTQIRVPGRPNGRIGWVTRASFGKLHTTRWLIVVDRRRTKMTVYHGGRRRRQFPVGVGKRRTPTPAGHFWIRERIRVSDPASPYFPYALGTSDYSTLSEWPGGGVVGIHGDWNLPQLIPGHPSHGCIRMLDRDVGWLARHVPLGTPLRVR